MIKDVVVGGRLGDFFEMLYVLNQKHNLNGDKFNVYITENVELHGCDNFKIPLKNTFESLYPIIIQQPYVNKFEIFDFQITEYDNLNIWRKRMYEDLWPWTRMLNTLFFDEEPELKYGAWLSFDGKNDLFKDKVVIHRISDKVNNLVNWDYLTKNNECVFVGLSYWEYEAFPYRYNVPFHKYKTLSQLVAILNSAKFFVGNQTGPLSIANAMNVPRLGELWKIAARIHKNQHIYTPEFNWISEDDFFLGTINNYINYKPL